VQHHYEGHWKGRALKIETFFGPEMARAKRVPSGPKKVEITYRAIKTGTLIVNTISGPLKVCCCNIPSIYPSWPTSCLLKRSYFDLFLTNLIFPWQHIWPSQGLLPQNSVSLPFMRFLPTGVQRFDFDKINLSVGTLILALSRFAGATFPQLTMPTCQ
jgi:hypothetical protein